MNFRTDEGERLGLPGNDDGFLLELLEAAAANGALVNPHAENADLIKLLAAAARSTATARRSSSGTAAARDYVEAEALERVGFLAMLAGPTSTPCTSRTHCRCGAARSGPPPGSRSRRAALPHARHVRGRRHPRQGQPAAAPPPDREALWEAVAAGDVDTIGSDHVPRPGRYKEGGLW